MKKESIAHITTIYIVGEQRDKKIEVKLDIFNEILIFEGYCKIKINGITQWQLFAEEIHGFDKDDEKINFEKISKSIYDTMMRRIEMYNLTQAFLHEVTEVQIKED